MGTGGLLGRDELIETVVSWIERDRRAFGLLHGPAGVGKTALADAVVDRLANGGRAVHRVRATEASQMVPFGALAPLLAGGSAPPQGWEHPAGVLTALLERVRDRFGDSLVIVVDDLPLLDAGSLTAIVQLGDHRGVQVLATARDEHGVPPVFRDLATGGTGRTWVVPPLADADALALAERLLGTPISPSSARRLLDAAQGLPLFVRELVGEAVARGTVEFGPMAASLSGLPLTPRLHDLVAGRVSRLGEPERLALELVVAGRPFPIGALATSEVEALESLELVDVVEGVDGQPALELTHPLIGEAVRESTPSTRWGRQLRAAADVWHDLPATPDTLLRATVMRRAGGGTVPPAEVLAAAGRAIELLDHRLVIDLVDALAEEGDHDALVLRGTARSAIGEPSAALDLRAAISTAPDDAAIARAAQRLALELGTRRHDALGAAEAARKAHDLVSDPDCRRFLDAEARKWELLTGTGSLGELDSAADPATQLNDATVRAIMAAMSGRLDEAERLGTQAIPLARAHREVLTYGEELLQLHRLLSIALRGDAVQTQRAIDTARADAEASGRADDAEGMWRYLEAMATLEIGDYERAEILASQAQRALVERDFIGLEVSATAMRACALAHLGRLGDASAVLDGLADSAWDDQRSTHWARRARAEIWYRQGRVEAAIEEIVAAADHGFAGGFAAVAALTAYRAVIYGAGDRVVDRLETFAAEADGELFATLARHARGQVVGDRELLVAARDWFAAHGLSASAHAAAADLVGETAGGGSDAPRPVLTTRELEVAQAAASRRKSREIAESLGVSVRTVDNHLAKTYRKLGIAGRAELRDALVAAGLLPP